jgi:hypothetical protein
MKASVHVHFLTILPQRHSAPSIHTTEGCISPRPDLDAVEEKKSFVHMRKLLNHVQKKWKKNVDSALTFEKGRQGNLNH